MLNVTWNKLYKLATSKSTCDDIINVTIDDKSDGNDFLNLENIVSLYNSL